MPERRIGRPKTIRGKVARASTQRPRVQQQALEGGEDATHARWEACGTAFRAVLALLKAAEPNPASTNALAGFLTTVIARWSACDSFGASTM